jgi:hypothetical protein
MKSLEEVREYIESEGFELLTTEYISKIHTIENDMP